MAEDYVLPAGRAAEGLIIARKVPPETMSAFEQTAAHWKCSDEICIRQLAPWRLTL
jgi:hypothetical protein